TTVIRLSVFWLIAWPSPYVSPPPDASPWAWILPQALLSPARGIRRMKPEQDSRRPQPCRPPSSAPPARHSAGPRPPAADTAAPTRSGATDTRGSEAGNFPLRSAAAG